MRKRSNPFFSLARITICIISVFISASICSAATLYEQSLLLLQPRVEKAPAKDFTFVVLGDSRDNDEVFRKALRLAASFNPLFIVHGGDVSPSGSPEEVDRFLLLLEDTVPDIPVFPVMGNHERKKVFEEKLGPLNYALDEPKLQMKLVVLDNSGSLLPPEGVRFLREQLETKRSLKFVVMHIPPKTGKWNWHTFTTGAPELVQSMTDSGVTAAFFSHVHMFAEDTIKGIPYIVTGGAGAPLVEEGFPGDPSHHIVVVTVKGRSVSCKMVKIRD